MIITAISQNKKHENLVSIFLDDKFWLGLDKNDLFKYDIFKGKEVTEELKLEIEQSSQLGKLKSSILNLISRRPRSRKEITDHLTFKRQTPPELAEKAIQASEKLGYINDENFARWFIEMRLATNRYGFNKIKAQLQAKGVNSKLIESVYRELQAEKPELADNTEAIQKLIKKFSPSIKAKTPTEHRQKLITKLMGRGFQYNEIKRCLDIS